MSDSAKKALVMIVVIFALGFILGWLAASVEVTWR